MQPTLDEFNPYEAPKSVAPSTTAARRLGRGELLIAWFAVCALNLVVPLLLGLSSTGRRGRIGMFAASVLLFGVGFRLCFGARRLARPLLVGGVFVGLSQIVPFLQIAAGLVGMQIGVALGLVVTPVNKTTPRIQGVSGGFLVTLITGTLLMSAALVAGLVIRFFTPPRWWGDPAEAPIMGGE